MITLKSYVCDEWQAGSGAGTVLKHAVTGEEIATVGSRGLNFRKMLDYGREVGGPALRAMSFPRRAALLKEMAGVLGQHLPEFYEIAASYGATRFDAWMDIEGGIGTLAAYSSMARRRLPDSTFVVDGDVEGLSKGGTFVGQHIWVSLEGVAVGDMAARVTAGR
ncbi:MAG: phenylacetic acid degradation bifunctional protein PaaZ, partial [Nitrospinota bacterium]